MSLLSFQSSAEALHSSRFRPAGKRWFFARASLYADRIEFTGWTWRGRQTRVVPLASIAEVKWRSSIHKVENFVLVRYGKEPVRCWIKGPGLWKYEIEAHADNLAPPVTRKKTAVTHAA